MLQVLCSGISCFVLIKHGPKGIGGDVASESELCDWTACTSYGCDPKWETPSVTPVF